MKKQEPDPHKWCKLEDWSGARQHTFRSLWALHISLCQCSRTEFLIHHTLKLLWLQRETTTTVENNFLQLFVTTTSMCLAHKVTPITNQKEALVNFVTQGIWHVSFSRAKFRRICKMFRLVNKYKNLYDTNSRINCYLTPVETESSIWPGVYG